MYEKFSKRDYTMKQFSKAYINEALKAIKFTELTKVQEQVIDIFDKYKDMVIEAKTGSGKTHAFLLPILDNIDEKLNQVQAVILAPTRELATQILNFANELVSYSPKEVIIDSFIGGDDRADGMRKLSNRMPHIAIGTPGRLKDLVITENILKIYTAKYFVIDEADMTLDENFIMTVDNLAAAIDAKAKFMVFSATIPVRLKPFLSKYLDNPMMLSVHPEEISNLNIEHYFIKTKEQDRFLYLSKIVKAINPYLAIIFCNTKESAEKVYEWMVVNKLNATLIHGGIDYRKRKQLMKRVNSLEFQYVVATDILARGIDIVGTSHIINFELPRDVEFYIHRTGRTGRVNFEGVALSLYEFNDNSYLNQLEAKGIKCEYKEIKNNEIVEGTIRNKREKRIYAGGKIEKTARDMVRRPTKVKPGYKKKYKQEVEEQKRKLRKKRRNKNGS